VVWDWESYWAVELEGHPSAELSFRERVFAFYRQLWQAGRTCDFVHPEGDLERYPVVVVPSLYLTTPRAAASLRAYVEGGGTLVVSYFSGIVDASDTVYPGSYPGAFRDVLGLTVEEFLPLREGEQVQLSVVPDGSWDTGGTADAWTETVHLSGAEAVLSYADGPAAGGPAVTRHAFGRGSAWYISARLADDLLARLLGRVCADAGIALSTGAEVVQGDLEVVRRQHDKHTFTTVINHGEDDAELALPGTELLTGSEHRDRVVVPAGEVRVIRQDRVP
jgi:beta-galactosidase